MTCVYAESGTFLLRLHGRIFDVTTFAPEHPGGTFLSDDAMRSGYAFDAGNAFDVVEHTSSAQRRLERMLVPPPPGRSRWPTPRGCGPAETTFPIVRLSDKLSRGATCLLEVVARLLEWVTLLICLAWTRCCQEIQIRTRSTLSALAGAARWPRRDISSGVSQISHSCGNHRCHLAGPATAEVRIAPLQRLRDYLRFRGRVAVERGRGRG